MAGLPDLGDSLHHASESLAKTKIGQAAQRGMAKAHPTNVDIGYAIELVAQDLVYTSCSVYRGTEAMLVQDKKVRMIKTNNEHNSPGIAGGLVLGGRRAMIASQNSGSFNEGDGMFTFLSPKVNDVPVLVLMSWRRDKASEPHYEIGRITEELTHLMFDDERVPKDRRVFGKEDGSDFLNEFKEANNVARRKHHMAIALMPEEASETVFEPAPQRRSEDEIAHAVERYRATIEAERIITEHKGTLVDSNPFLKDINKAFDRFDAVRMVVEYYRKLSKNVRFVVSNGFNSRTVLDIFGDDPSVLYLPGYMGGAAAVGKGLAMAREDVLIVVLDGNENRQMSNMDKHLKLNDQPNMEIVTFDDNDASSVGGAKSMDLTSDEINFSRVVQTHPAIYSKFVKTVDRVQGTPQHTREFKEALAAIPRRSAIEYDAWTPQRILEKGIPQGF